MRHPPTILLLLPLALGACERASAPMPEYDPLAAAWVSTGRIDNLEAVIPAACYTDTADGANPCWTCHTAGQGRNRADTVDLQREYAFSDAAMDNGWTALFIDRREQAAAFSTEDMDAWIAADNYTPLRTALAARLEYPGFVPDLDLHRGVDDQGFALDGSGWRALRFKPSPGTFWPTNGTANDVWIRLPPAFRRDREGRDSRAVYRLNLALLEAAIASPQGVEREVEAVDERLIGVDLDADGELGIARRIVRLPARYAGAASDIALVVGLYPQGTEFLHSLRYLDLDQPGARSRRVRELRYARKWRMLTDEEVAAAYAEEAREKAAGLLPRFAGTPLAGLTNDFGWRYQGFIEDADGRLRVQTHAEQQFCMGCHSNLGVTVDGSFSFARKLPGSAGWAPQDLRGQLDTAQLGHADPEVLTYFRRARGGDEFLANDELLRRFWHADGTLDEAEVRRAAIGGDRDLAWLLLPSAERADALNRAYRVKVLAQDFARGREAPIAPPRRVLKRIEDVDTGLAAQNRVYDDGSPWLAPL
ncbi:hypothetical protein [Sinimarinibacterium thermocellulolyticum]|uniref:Lipoprotein n=1 Tax=Sinimarinibacterium thermocellulolyticum TaxID=3170016 RepID=A0ABV2ABD4_9GAMM